jgi:hypothetical protein
MIVDVTENAESVKIKNPLRTFATVYLRGILPFQGVCLFVPVVDFLKNPEELRIQKRRSEKIITLHNSGIEVNF